MSRGVAQRRSRRETRVGLKGGAPSPPLTTKKLEPRGQRGEGPREGEERGEEEEREGYRGSLSLTLSLAHTKAPVWVPPWVRLWDGDDQ